MTTFELSEFWIAKIFLVNKIDSSDQIYFYASNRPVQSPLASINMPCYDILESAKLSQKMRDNIPSNSEGRVTLSNKPNSMGVNRKLSDLLHRYTPMFQDVEFYYCVVSENDVNIVSDLTLAWSDTVDGYRYNAASDSIILQLSSSPIPERTISYEILPEQWSDAPTNSYGKHLPLAMGSGVEVDCLNVGQANAYDRYFVYATTLGTKFVNSGVQNYYAKSKAGRYEEVVTATSASTDHYGYGTNNSAGNFTDLDVEYFQPINAAVGGSTHKMMYGGEVTLKGGSASAGWSGDIVIRIYQQDSANNGSLAGFQTPIGEARIDKSLLSASLGSGSAFTTGFEFDEPVVITNNSGRVWLSITNSSPDAARGGTVYIASDPATSYPWSLDVYTRLGDKGWIAPVGGSLSIKLDDMYIALYCLVLTDTPTPATSAIDDKTGLGASYVIVSQSSSSSGNGLDKLDMKLKIDGLEDDSSGSITGVSNQLLDGGVEVAEMLIDYGWNGSNWISQSIFDGTFKSASHTNHNLSGGDTYPREIGGTTRNRVSIRQVLTDICRNSIMKIARIPGANKVGAFLWGEEQSEAAVITNSEMNFEEFFATSHSTVINDIKINYDRRIINVQFAEQVLNDPSIREHVANYSLNYVDNAGLLGESKSLYGQRDLQNNLFNLINDETSASSLAQFLARTQSAPAEFARVSVPFVDFSSLKPFDVVTLKSTKLPSEAGSSPSVSPITYEDLRYCYFFDRSGPTYIDCGGSVAGFDSSVGDFSFYFYVRLNVYFGNASTNYELFNSTDYSTYGIGLRVEDVASGRGKICLTSCSVADGLQQVKSDALTYPNDMAWHVVKGSYTDSTETFLLWVDDTQVLNTTIPRSDDPSVNFTIGVNGQTWNGWIKDVALWNSAITDVSYITPLNRKNQVLHIDGTDRG